MISDKPVESIAFRFVQIFEAHGIHRNQIPRFFGHGLTVQDVQNDESLIAQLDETILSDVCSMFAIRRQWLDGAEKEIYPCHHFYKDLDLCAQLINDLKARNSGGIDAILFMSEQPIGDEPALLLFNEFVGSIDDKEIYRHHLCPFDAASYWRCRGYITACVSMAWKHDIYVRGRRVSLKDIKPYTEGKRLLAMEDPMSFQFAGALWHPDDMGRDPAAYLKGIDPEVNNHGLRAALSFWLELDKSETLNPTKNESARPLFERELAKYHR